MAADIIDMRGAGAAPEGLDLDGYVRAFGAFDVALERALADLFAVDGDAELDLNGRHVRLRAPIGIDAARARGAKTMRNGRISLRPETETALPRDCFALSVTGLPAGASLCLDSVTLSPRGMAGGLFAHSAGGSVDLSGCDIADARGAALHVLGGGTGALVLDRCRVRDGAGVTVTGMGANVRDCRFDGAAPALVLAGRGARVAGCRFAHGGVGLRPGLCLLVRDAACQVADCDFDGASIHWSETAAVPFAGAEDDFAGLSVTACRFTGRDLPRHACWIEVAADGPGRSVRDLSVTGSLFAAEGGRVERVESARRGLDHARMRRVTFAGNVYRGVSRPAESPATVRVDLPLAERTWTVDIDGALPFAAPPAQVVSLLPEGGLTDAAGEKMNALPVVDLSPHGLIRMRFEVPARGTLALTVRGDRPG